MRILFLVKSHFIFLPNTKDLEIKGLGIIFIIKYKGKKINNG